VELRRLLWTFSHALGSTELTWEAIEASAVIGTLEPHVPVVTLDEFFRCVLKTVHLVVAELRRKAERFAPRATPWACLAEMNDKGRGDASSRSSSCSPPPSQASEPAEDVTEGHPSSELPSEHESPVQRDLPHSQRDSYEGASIFQPAPDTSQDPSVIDRLQVMLLSSHGIFDAQHVSLDRGHLILTDPDDEPTFMQRVLGSSSQVYVDLSTLKDTYFDVEVLNSPAASMLPTEGCPLDRVIVFTFGSEHEVLCFCMPSVSDRDALLLAVQTQLQR